MRQRAVDPNDPNLLPHLLRIWSNVPFLSIRALRQHRAIRRVVRKPHADCDRNSFSATMRLKCRDELVSRWPAALLCDDAYRVDRRIDVKLIHWCPLPVDVDLWVNRNEWVRKMSTHFKAGVFRLNRYASRSAIGSDCSSANAETRTTRCCHRTRLVLTAPPLMSILDRWLSSFVVLMTPNSYKFNFVSIIRLCSV